MLKIQDFHIIWTMAVCHFPDYETTVYLFFMNISWPTYFLNLENSLVKIFFT